APAPNRGLLGAARRLAEAGKQLTTYPEAVAILEAEDYRLSSAPEDGRAAWEARFERFQRNAALGDVWAMMALHLCYAKGLGTDKDPERAYHWARQVTRVRKPVGCYLLGRCYTG